MAAAAEDDPFLAALLGFTLCHQINLVINFACVGIRHFRRRISERRSRAHVLRALNTRAASNVIRRSRLLNTTWFVESVCKMDTELFRYHFRLSLDRCHDICRILDRSDKAVVHALRYTHKKGRPPFSTFFRVVVTLWRLANNEAFRSLSARFGFSESTVSRICASVIDTLYDMRSRFIK